MTEFETRLKERLEGSARRVHGTDDLYARAEQRHRAHTVRRRVGGGLGALALVAVTAVGGAWIADELRTEPAPVVTEPEPRPTNPGHTPSDDATDAPSTSATSLRFLVANGSLLDDVGLPDDHEIRRHGWTIRKAYPLVDQDEDGTWGWDELIYEFEDAAGAARVVTLDDDGVRIVVNEGRDGDDVRLHGVGEFDGWRRALISRVTADGPVVTLDGVFDVVASGSLEIPGTVERVSTVTVDRLGSDDLVLIEARDSKGFAGVVTYDTSGQVVPLDWAPFDATNCVCRHSSVTGSGARIAWIEQDVIADGRGGEVRVIVADPFTNETVAHATLLEAKDALADDRGLTIEYLGNDVVVNAEAGHRWHLDVATSTLTELSELPLGYAALVPSSPRDPNDALTIGTWSDVPQPPAGDPGFTWRFGDPVWTGADVLVTTSGWRNIEADVQEERHRLLRYTPAVQRWSELSSPPAHGEIHWLGDHLILIATGSYARDEGPMRTWSYDLDTNRWTERGTVPLPPRNAPGHSSTWTGSELILWGGLHIDWQAGDNRARGTLFNDGAAYDAATRTWRTIAPSTLSPRGDHGAVWNGRRLVVFGGGAVGDFETEFIWNEPGERHDAAVYDPATDTWTTIQSPGPIGPVIAADWTGSRIVFFNGRRDDERLPRGYVWDPVTGDATWLPDPPFPDPTRRDVVDHVWAPEMGAWIVWGGACGEGCNHGSYDGAILDPATVTWTYLADPDGRTGYGSASVWTGDGLLVLGGAEEEYDGFRAATPRLWRPEP